MAETWNGVLPKRGLSRHGKLPLCYHVLLGHSTSEVADTARVGLQVGVSWVVGGHMTVTTRTSQPLEGQMASVGLPLVIQSLQSRFQDQ